ncbi:MAG: polysaccharide biosynthesis/export family protein [Thermoanaerobaculia bacterium]
MRRVTAAFGLLGAAALAWVRPVSGQELAEYRIGPRDVLEIKVLQIPDLNVERRVTGEGKIELPLIGDFPVAGLSAGDVRDRLEAMLTTKYVNRADVSVSIKEFANKPISVLGAVGHPGNLGGGRWNLIQVITASGGIAENAGKKINIFRRSDNSLSDTLTITTDELYKSFDPKWNVPIVPGDSITVSGRSTATVYILGDVKNNGAISVDADEPISLLKVIVKAGGLTERASHTLHIKRKMADGKVVEIKVNYARILAGKDPDVTLQPEDIILVKESFF